MPKPFGIQGHIAVTVDATSMEHHSINFEGQTLFRQTRQTLTIGMYRNAAKSDHSSQGVAIDISSGHRSQMDF